MARNDQLLERLRSRLSNIHTRVGVTHVNNAGGFQKLQLSGRKGDRPDSVNHYLPYGLDFIPLPPSADGKMAEGLMIRANGWEAVLPVADRRHRDKSGATEVGDFSIYSASGAKLTLKMNGDAELDSPANVKVKAAKNLELEAGELMKLLAKMVVVEALENIDLDAPDIKAKGNLTGEGQRPKFGSGAGSAREVALISDDAYVTTGSSLGLHKVIKNNSGY